MLLSEFPVLKTIRGVGMTDNPVYAEVLAEKFDYTNTFYDCEPRIDFTEPHPELAGRLDFILSSDVFEHIAPPLSRALDEVHRMLKPEGFLVATAPCPTRDTLIEHFPELHDFRVLPLGAKTVLINRRRNGQLEITEDLAFHGGEGATLEMRCLTPSALEEQLTAAGFREVSFLTADLPRFGLAFGSEVSQPLIARKAPFRLSRETAGELIDQWHRRDRQVTMASRSRWLHIGRLLKVGPRLIN